ncbi:MAG TPA: hypothetical protein VK762_29045 [Polyangiaceae bacterium]|nr:hypothetical protein [Polyangiaceae bacterium]
MNSFRPASAVAGALCLGVLACGGSAPPEPSSPGVTNIQPTSVEISPTVAPVREGRCLSRGDVCGRSLDCCSQWCVNEHCEAQHP